MSNIPLPRSIHPIQRFILLKNVMKRSIANADMMNGIANPAEYAIRSDVPAIQLELVESTKTVPPAIGNLRTTITEHQDPIRPLRTTSAGQD